MCELAAALKGEDIPARGRTIIESTFSAGEVFLSEARALDCDLLVKPFEADELVRRVALRAKRVFV